MGQMKRIFELNEQLKSIDDFGYQYEQWLEEQRIIEMQHEAELAAYQEMLSDGY
jgi:hypothetical protein